MVIFLYTWSKLFSIHESNSTAISKHGWFPYNHNLIIYPSIHASTTQEETEVYLLENGKIDLPLHKWVEITDLIDTTTQVIDPRFASKPIPEDKIVANFLSGKVTIYLDKILMEHGLHKARGEAKKEQERG